ncbi:MAG: hypothetical protein J5614_05555 [Paludibacteraceae bacterium]|nr:hypothetical protein [Paludibacteraceae bacterium]
MERSIKILDQQHQPIGEKMTATDTDILTYLAKGFIVEDRRTGEMITEADINASIGISDGEMIMG